MRRAGLGHHPQGRLPLGDDQLQSRDRVHGLRHVRPPVFRRADVRARPGHPRLGVSQRGHRVHRRPDTEQSGHPARPAARAYPWHDGQEHRQRRGPREVLRHAGPHRRGPARVERTDQHGGRGCLHRQGGLPRPGASVLRAFRRGDERMFQSGRVGAFLEISGECIS